MVTLVSDSVGLQIGTIVAGRYKLLRIINRGGMGIVYEAEHLGTGGRVALKMILPELIADAAHQDRFQREARVTANVKSHHIVKVFDASFDEGLGRSFLVMELLDGMDLGALIRAYGPQPPELVVRLLWQAALGLDKTHAQGVLHRDLKPENLFLTHDDAGEPQLKILDFGLAKVVAATQAKTTSNLGTTLYMSPEQCDGASDVDARADTHALAHVAFTLLTGRAYWQTEAERGGNPAVIRAMSNPVREPASIRAKGIVALPVAFDAWFAQATSLDRAERFDTTPELVQALATALGAPAPAIQGVAVPLSRRRVSAHDAKGGVVVAQTTSLSGLSSGTQSKTQVGALRMVLVGLGAVGLAAAMVLGRARHRSDEAALRTNPAGSGLDAAPKPAPVTSPSAVAPVPSVAPPSPSASNTTTLAPVIDGPVPVVTVKSSKVASRPPPRARPRTDARDPAEIR
jgi:serine/threonine-protein kinase